MLVQKEINFSYWVDSGNGGGDDVVEDGCDLPINNVFLLEGDVLYNSDTDIAGFQFSVEGTTASSAAGGSAVIWIYSVCRRFYNFRFFITGAVIPVDVEL